MHVPRRTKQAYSLTHIFCTYPERDTHIHTRTQAEGPPYAHTHTELSEHGVKSEGLLMEADSLAAVSSKCRGNADLCPAGCNWISFLPSAEFKRKKERKRQTAPAGIRAAFYRQTATLSWPSAGNLDSLCCSRAATPIRSLNISPGQIAFRGWQLYDNL